MPFTYKPRKKLEGTKIGHWAVGEYVPTKMSGKDPYYICVCDCGTQKNVWACSLLRQDSLSCGCKRGVRREDFPAKKPMEMRVKYE